MIQVDDVTKRYGDTLAVNGVSFRVGAGEIVGFLGPNGAGKSTLLKMMSSWLPLTSGRILIDGHDVERDPQAVRCSLGYLPEHNALYDGMRVDRFLRFIGRARGLAGPRLDDRMAWVVEKCSLAGVMGKRIHQCSKGFRQRVGVAQALIHNPRVILLDEPTHGLDALQVVAFREFIRGLSHGRAILFSSHVLAEVTSITARLLVINHGELLADASVKSLEERARQAKATLEEVVLDIVRSHGGVAAA